MTHDTNSSQTRTRRDFLRSLLGSGLFFGLLAANIAAALKHAQTHLSFAIGPAPGAAPLLNRSRLYSTELLKVDWPRQIWYWPREYVDFYWSDPKFFAANASFRAEFHGVTLCEGRVAPAVEAAHVRGPTLRVLQLRSGPGPGPLLAGDLGFAFALTDADGRPRFPCDDARILAEIRKDVERPPSPIPPPSPPASQNTSACTATPAASRCDDLRKTP